MPGRRRFTWRPVWTFRVAAAAVAAVPRRWLWPLAERVGTRFGPRLLPDRTAQLATHIRRVDPDLDETEAAAAAARGIGSYARYWAESFRLPTMSAAAVDRGFVVTGYDRIEASLAAGVGPILVLPHLGGWEWAAAWLNRVKHQQVTAVAERLEPPELFDWFVSLRRSYGIDVVPLGPRAIAALVKAVRQRRIVCLLSDRDLSGTGVAVTFFGETTTLPAGPAVLARRTGAPLLPTAVYFRGPAHLAVVGPAVRADESLPLRDDVARMTQQLAWAMEDLIGDAPDQWHLLEPNWPSDRAGYRTPIPAPAE
ncbi:MAG: phosphatidylinositol mannoside acyltransferase [Acidimicrobiales bacterium]